MKQLSITKQIGISLILAIIVGYLMQGCPKSAEAYIRPEQRCPSPEMHHALSSCRDSMEKKRAGTQRKPRNTKTINIC